MSDSFARRDAGFTLMELIVVVSLILILTALSTFSLAWHIPGVRLKSVAQDINIQIRKARLLAIQSGRNVHVEFYAVSNGKTYSPFIWQDQDNDNTPTADEIIYKMPVNNVLEFEGYRGVLFDSTHGVNGVDFSSGGLKFILNRRGLANDSGTIHLINSRLQKRTLHVTLGGAVRVS